MRAKAQNEPDNGKTRKFRFLAENRRSYSFKETTRMVINGVELQLENRVIEGFPHSIARFCPLPHSATSPSFSLFPL